MPEKLTLENTPAFLERMGEDMQSIKQMLSEQRAQNDAMPKPMTIVEAAAFLHLEKPTLYALVQRGEIPFYKQGKRLYFFKEELVEWIKTGKKTKQHRLQEEAQVLFLDANKRKVS